MTVYILFGRGRDYHDLDEVWDIFLSEEHALAEAERLTVLGGTMADMTPFEQVAFSQEYDVPSTLSGYSFSVQRWETKP